MNPTPSEHIALVRADSISKDFGRVRALDQVSFEIRRGEILGLLGPNGAGKTTAVRILTGFFPPSEGKVWLDGRELFKQPKELKRRIGYLPESVNLYPDMRVEEFLDFAAGVKSVPPSAKEKHLESIAARCGLWEVKRRLIGHLSKGFRQRLGIAQALVGDPDVLVFDEPTNGLDPQQILEIRKLIRELGKDRTVILCTHILPEVSAVCDKVLILNRGKVVASGTTEELEKGLRGKREIFISIGDPLKKEKACGILSSLPGVGRVEVVDEKPELVALVVSVGEDTDPRPEITRLFVAEGIPLLEIRSSHLSLEEIFMKVIVEEDPAGVGS